MIRYCYDIEVLKNFFSVTFVNTEDSADKHVFYIGLGKEDYSDLLVFLKQEMVLIGYNNDSYDNPVLRFIMGYNGKKMITSELYALSAKLVDDGFREDKAIKELRYPRRAIYPWLSIDLMRILAFDKLGISLKQTAINLKWPRILDMPIDHDTNISVSQIDTILDYNLNDTLITKRLYEEIEPLRKLRDDLGKIYNIDLSSASKSRMANLILENIYGKEMHMDMRSVRTMRTQRYKVFLGDCVAKFVKFQSPELRELYDRITSTYVYEYNEYRYSETVYYANCAFVLGIGGLHTKDEAGKFETDDKYLIQDMDGASYYPNLIINNNFYPAHLGPDFIKVLKRITDERMAAKKAGDKVKAEGLKITINSIFGKFGSPHFWLQDAKQLLSTTLTGQLGLLMLAEGMFMNGITVISCNTDGIICKIPRALEGRYYEIAKAWEKTTGISLEFTPYSKYIRRDVNSYIAVKPDGHTKEKGAFLKEVDLEKSYHMPIVAKSLYEYFVNGVPVKDTIGNCKDIMEFCLSQKTGGNFGMEIHTLKGIETLQKTNRFYITKKGGRLVKKEHFTKKLTGLQVGRLVGLLNDYDPTIPFEKYEIDLAFYEKEAMKIIDEIEPKQLSLFDTDSLGHGTLSKMKTKEDTNKDMPKEEIMSVRDLNKLGKNQFAKKLDSIVNSNQKIEKISPRYVYIIDFDTRSMVVELYCLAKAIRQKMTVSKEAYKKARIEKGNLLFCSKFEKTEYGHMLAEYRLTNKIEEEKNLLM
jgi:hypothetical protein